MLQADLADVEQLLGRIVDEVASRIGIVWDVILLPFRLQVEPVAQTRLEGEVVLVAIALDGGFDRIGIVHMCHVKFRFPYSYHANLCRPVPPSATR